MIRLYLSLPAKLVAVALAKELSGNQDITDLPMDGRLPRDDPNGTPYNIDAIDMAKSMHGLYFQGGQHKATASLPKDAQGQPIIPADAVARYWLNGLWHGPEDTVPATLQAYRIYPDQPEHPQHVPGSAPSRVYG